MNLEDIIKKLSPELQEKANACKSTEELIALGKEHAVDLTPEELEAIAGGKGGSVKSCRKTKCPKCGSTNVTLRMDIGPNPIIVIYKCKNCGYSWKEEA